MANEWPRYDCLSSMASSTAPECNKSEARASDNGYPPNSEGYTFFVPTGNLLTNAITLNGATRTEQYSYDELNRLSTVNYGDGAAQSYSFDNMGNRLQKADSGTGTENYTYDAANMLLT